jgi:hypothetical protein
MAGPRVKHPSFSKILYEGHIKPTSKFLPFLKNTEYFEMFATGFYILQKHLIIFFGP